MPKASIDPVIGAAINAVLGAPMDPALDAWAAERVFRAFGLRVKMRVNREGLLEALAPFTPPGAVILAAINAPGAPPVDAPVRDAGVDAIYSLRSSDEDGASAPLYAAYAGAALIASGADLERTLYALDSHLRLYIAARAPRRIFVHAGVVGWKGRAIVIPGRTHSGKSSLVAALLRAGARYYSDEYAVLDARGRVHPYARPLTLRDGSGGQRRCPASELGAVTGKTPLPVGLVLCTQYRAGARFRPQSLTTGQALLAMLENTVPARLSPERVMPALRAACISAESIRGTRGEADALAAWLLRRT